MHNLLSPSIAVLAASSSKTASSATSSIGTLLFLVVLALLVYVFFLRPRSQQARRQRETLQQVSVGDEVLTGAGIFGRILDVEADRITIETAPGTRITVLRSTIARRLTEHPEEETAWSDEDTHEALSQGHEEDGEAPEDPHGNPGETDGEAEAQ